MTNIIELEISIAEYKNQLQQVEQALENIENDSDRTSLINLQSDLNELLQLTQESLDAHRSGVESNTPKEIDEPDDPFAEEMRLLMTEINQNQQRDTTEEQKSQNEEQEGEETELSAIIGKKYLAPHTHSWGSKTYHNAFICSFDTDTNIKSNEMDLNDIKVRVFFMNPTHSEMIPCSYYLDGDCRFDESKCRFSHGEVVLFGELKEYTEPDFSLLSVPNALVLAKQKDRIWSKGRLIHSDFDMKTCRIKLEANKKELTCPFEDILPLEKDDSIETDEESNSECDDDNDEMRQSILIEKSLLTPAQDQPLGEWEKHTKGFGSKMLQKYGYIIGTGLGHNGEGIIVPIGAQILPPGRSLDHCMELREQSNGDRDLFSVERKLKKLQKQQETINARAYEKEKQQQSNIFSFINESVFSTMTTSSTSASLAADTESNQMHTKLETHSTKRLNLTGFQIGEDIRKKEREIVRVKESIGRHKSGTTMHIKLQEQLKHRSDELERLKKSEINVRQEQTFRKNKSKITIF